MGVPQENAYSIFGILFIFIYALEMYRGLTPPSN